MFDVFFYRRVKKYQLHRLSERQKGQSDKRAWPQRYAVITVIRGGPNHITAVECVSWWMNEMTIVVWKTSVKKKQTLSTERVRTKLQLCRNLWAQICPIPKCQAAIMAVTGGDAAIKVWSVCNVLFVFFFLLFADYGPFWTGRVEEAVPRACSSFDEWSVSVAWARGHSPVRELSSFFFTNCGAQNCESGGARLGASGKRWRR